MMITWMFSSLNSTICVISKSMLVIWFSPSVAVLAGFFVPLVNFYLMWNETFRIYSCWVAIFSDSCNYSDRTELFETGWSLLNLTCKFSLSGSSIYSAWFSSILRKDLSRTGSDALHIMRVSIVVGERCYCWCCEVFKDSSLESFRIVSHQLGYPSIPRCQSQIHWTSATFKRSLGSLLSWHPALPPLAFCLLNSETRHSLCHPLFKVKPGNFLKRKWSAKSYWGLSPLFPGEQESLALIYNAHYSILSLGFFAVWCSSWF